MGEHVNKNVLVILPILCLSMNSNASYQEELQDKLDQILRDSQADLGNTEANRYLAINSNLINKKLGSLKEYEGQDCTAIVSLSDDGSVKNVDLSNQQELCRKVFNTVWSISRFPMPADKDERDKLTTMRLRVRPL